MSWSLKSPSATACEGASASDVSYSVYWVLLAMGVLVGADQGVKGWVQGTLAPYESWPIIPDWFQVTLVMNRGMAFSMFEDLPPVVILGFTALMTLVLLGLVLWRRVLPLPLLVGFGLILGGATGNLVDRVLYGHVVDYIDVVIIHYPIFNLADSFIFIGVVVLGFYYWMQSSPPETSTSNSGASPPDSSQQEPD